MKNLIVVTGGAGFIGSNLIKFLIQKTKSKIISIDNYSTGKVQNHINHKNVKYIKCENINISKKLKPYKKKLRLFFILVNFLEYFKVFQELKLV